MLKDNNDFYLQALDNSRIFKHNIIAKLIPLKSLGDKKVNSMVDNVIKELNKNYLYEEVKQLPYGFNGIVYGRLNPYQKKLKIKIDNEISEDIFDILDPKKYNVLAGKFMISLDNAIEASLKSKDKLLNVRLCMVQNKIVVEIINSFDDVIDVDTIGLKNYSTKGSKRGIGLFSILRDKEVSVKIKIVNNLFILRIET